MGDQSCRTNQQEKYLCCQSGTSNQRLLSSHQKSQILFLLFLEEKIFSGMKTFFCLTINHLTFLIDGTHRGTAD